MSKLIYAANISLDGFWNELQRHIGTALPRDVRLHLKLVDHRRFDNGVIYVRHAGETQPDRVQPRPEAEHATAPPALAAHLTHNHAQHAAVC